MPESALELLDQVVQEMGGVMREGQREMARQVAVTLEDSTHLLVQAGTGTGKSLGYLAPLLTHCVNTREVGVVSTATLGLQRQIMTQDIPRILQTLSDQTGSQAKVALLKGWSNYICLYRLKGEYTEDMLFSDPEQLSSSASTSKISALGAEVKQVRAWAEETDTGDRDDLVPGVSDRAWRTVSVSKRDCLGRNCPLQDECFAMRAREKCKQANLVVTNHALLGIQAVGTSQVLPEFDCIVVDEAHELEKVTRSQATVGISGSSLEHTAQRLRRNGKILTDDLASAGRALDRALRAAREGLIMGAGPEDIEVALRSALAGALDASKQLSQAGADASNQALILAKNAAASLVEELEVLSVVDESVVRWISRDREGSPSLYAAPLNVSGMLASAIWADRGAVLTSATLDLGGSFDAMARQTGLAWAEEDWQGIDVGSPFDYAKQSIVYVASHLPPPGREGPTEQALAEMADLAQASGGGMLALYSSRAGAELAAQYLRDSTDLTVLCQGEENLSTLVKRFSEDEDSCLVGTLSLWQGVDVPGRACRLVVIDRIPFPRPNDPLVQARTRAISKRGGNGFMQISLTHAALLLAQAAGRLLRRSSDRGVVAILDSRVRTKSYGSFIMNSLPPMWKCVDPDMVRESLSRLNNM